MWIMNQTGTETYNSDFFDHFLVVEKDDANLIVASKGRGSDFYTLGRYADKREAQGTLRTLHNALRCGDAAYDMPLSVKTSGERTAYDKRTKRKGGS